MASFKSFETTSDAESISFCDTKTDFNSAWSNCLVYRFIAKSPSCFTAKNTSLTIDSTASTDCVGRWSIDSQVDWAGYLIRDFIRAPFFRLDI